MTIMKASIGLFVAFWLLGCSSTRANSEALTPTELRASAHALDGKEVVVRGWITLESEDFNIWADKKAMTRGRIIHCVSLTGYQQFLPRASELSKHYVEVIGTFRRDVVGKTGAVRLGACSKAAIQPASIRRL